MFQIFDDNVPENAITTKLVIIFCNTIIKGTQINTVYSSDYNDAA